jgi:hypothetical protein
MDWHLPGVTPEDAKRLAEVMRGPEGTVHFRGVYPQMLVADDRGGVILRVVTGSLVFILERDASMSLRFVHSAPGVGTREAVVDLRPLVNANGPSDQFFVALAWSPAELGLSIGRYGGDKLLDGTGSPASYTLQVAKDGSVVRLGDVGVSVMAVRIYSDGKQNVSPSAIKLWEDTRLAIETLLTGQSDAGYLYEVVIANAILSTLVTGFEGYCKQRFVELESEGLPADFASLVSKFLTKEERDRFANGEELELQRIAALSGAPVQQVLADRINFQDFDKANRAFNRGYGIRFGELAAVSSQDIEQLKKLIRYRHRIIHVSPLLGMLNAAEVPPENPYFSNKTNAELALKSFNDFISTLHAKTLTLRKTS